LVNSNYREVLKSGLVFHSQPIVRLYDKHVVGYELLARLKIGDSIVAPDVFLSDIEKEGLFSILDMKLAESVEKHIMNTGNSFISINVPSSSSLEYFMSIPFFIDNAHRIRLELLESVEWSDPEVLPVVERASKIGFHILIDDFGSGLSNLKTLLSSSIDGVKFDRGVLEAFMVEKKFDVLDRLVNLVLSLNKGVVLEGIESKKHERFVEKLNNVSLCQGYLYGRPELLSYEQH